MSDKSLPLPHAIMIPPTADVYKTYKPPFAVYSHNPLQPLPYDLCTILQTAHKCFCLEDRYIIIRLTIISVLD